MAFIFVFLSSVYGQKGSPLLTHYVESRDIENQSWAICQDQNQVMLFANRKGILSFDGDEWTTIRIPTIPYSMQKNPSDGRIYIGGDNNYGYLETTGSGSYRYVSLSGDSSGSGIITKIIFSNPVIWFYGEQTIIRYNLQTGRSDLSLASKSGYPFTGMMVTPKNTFINVMNKGLYRIEGDTLFPIVTGYLTEKTELLFSLPYNDNLVLVGLGNGSLSLFDGIKYYDFQIQDEGYLKDNILSEGIMLGDTAYAFSTLEGGAVIIDKSTRKVINTINNQNELPDDEVFAIGSDNSGGLWLSHQYGLTRADLSLPVSNYSVFPGLKGNFSSALSFNGELYVATSEGVYYLAEIKDYAEVEVLVKTESKAAEEPETEVVINWEEQQGNRKNIFNRIFGKKSGQAKVPVARTKTVTAPRTEETITRKKVSKLKSISHVFKKVDGLNAKCRQLVSTPYGILAATNKGLYNISDHKAGVIAGNRYINHITWVSFDDKYYIAADEGFFSVKNNSGKWTMDIPSPDFYNPVYSVTCNEHTLWLGCENIAYRMELENNPGLEKKFTYRISRDFPERYYVDLINDTVFLITESRLMFYNSEADRFDLYRPLGTASGENPDYFFPLSNNPLTRINNDWMSLSAAFQIKDKELSLLKLFNYVVSVTVEDKTIWVIDGNNKVFSIDRVRSSNTIPFINVFVKSMSNDRGISFDLQDVRFDRGDNVINFKIVAPAYLKQNTTQYQYLINKIMSDWSPWMARTRYEKAINRPGEYLLQVRAKDIWGNISEPRSVKFLIRAPFTRTLLFYILVGSASLFLVILFFRFRERQLQNANRILEEKVKERTAEIEAQKEEITASIAYASRIQMAMLPIEEHFRESFSDYFILFRPRDIVSGDFYWIGEDDNSIFFTVADCTGHGVPGAFMSTMGISTLNEIIANKHNLQANTILNLLREKTKMALHQTGKTGEAADGMDIAFCVLNKNRRILQYSGAFNSLIIFQDGELKEYKADRMPIGIHYGDEKPFTNYVINVRRGDAVYIFSDGFIDQFGGPEGSKFKLNNMKKLLNDIHYRPMVEQRKMLENEFAEWKGSENQVDDITILGIRI